MTNSASRKHPIWHWLLLAVFTLVLIAIIGFVIWASTPLGPAPAALAALESDADVMVETGNWLVFQPVQVEPDSGLIFYPGGRVDYRSYAPTVHLIAGEGYLVVIPAMPLNLAIFAPDTASEVMAAFPEIDAWAVGGHSLGGAMAARYAYQNPANVDGLALWAAYPAASDDLSSYDLSTASIFATNDGLATTDKIDASRPLLPPDTIWTAIAGGNHAQFGAYGPQPGDGEAAISPEEQWRQTAQATTQLLQIMTER